MTTPDFENMDTLQYDKALNEIAKDIFGVQDEELDKERVRLMQWALITLLLNKGLITQPEYESAVEEATLFFKMLKRRKRLLDENENTSESTDS